MRQRGHAISIHAPLTGSDETRYMADGNTSDFNPRSPYGERPADCVPAVSASTISIHAPLTGSDPRHSQPRYNIHQFQSTLPLRGATTDHLFDTILTDISIHAPLTGSDFGVETLERLRSHFNPRSPYGERLAVPPPHTRRCGFQSTLPLRGATLFRNPEGLVENFNPRSPYGERPTMFFVNHFHLDFNPRSPYGERHSLALQPRRLFYFNPRSPYGERLLVLTCTVSVFAISIHAPLTGSDYWTVFSIFSISYFNPRSPYGERRLATRRYCYGTYFNPRSPYGERRVSLYSPSKCSEFQSTLPLRGATRGHRSNIK